jgi:hypothetical protein
MGYPQQLFDDRRLDVVAHPRAGVRIQPDRQIRPERIGDRSQDGDARFSIAAFDPGEATVVHAGRIRQRPEADPGIRSQITDLDAYLAP